METPCGDGTWFVSVLQMMTNCIFISFCTKFRCPIDMEEVYPVALVSFLAEGGTRKGKRSFDQVGKTKIFILKKSAFVQKHLLLSVDHHPPDRPR